MGSKTVGAPLRVIFTLLFLWIFARLIAWNLPLDPTTDPVSLASGSAPIHNINATGGDEDRCLTECNRAGPAIHQKNKDRKMAVFVLSPSFRGKTDLKPTDFPSLDTHQSSLVLRPMEESAEHSLDASSMRSRNLPRENEVETLPPQNWIGQEQGSRLSGYFWAFYRNDSQVDEMGVRRGVVISNGQYGGSQIGGILSYPILSKPNHKLSVYGRVTAALAPLEQEEVALGAQIHPVQSVPFSIYVEQRLDAGSGDDRGMTFYVAGGTGPDPVFDKITLKTYAQAGYVLGDNESYFFDGSATLQQPIEGFSLAELSAGAGIWAGGQRDIYRVDIGPRADINVPLGAMSALVSIDWRVRVAGNARPGNGLAITVSTGF
ncbi:hypothetical protein [Parasphingorhabdus sp.]|uniref:hypothetical protein n=1 Tax=Parasphingorhabdus sp. TaxID=2709688 RepID=UPI00326736B6